MRKHKYPYKNWESENQSTIAEFARKVKALQEKERTVSEKERVDSSNIKYSESNTKPVDFESEKEREDWESI